MGDKKVKKLEKENVRRDEGKISDSFLEKLEIAHDIRLPRTYSTFITKHNGARLKADVFDYDDPNSGNGKNADGIAFINVTKIEEIISDLVGLNFQDPDWPNLFENGLIPFGDNGGGDMICFDYREDRSTNNPPIVIWNHDMGLKHRVVFVANNFEYFINMLHEPEDDE
jgi:hypothetical protein